MKRVVGILICFFFLHHGTAFAIAPDVKEFSNGNRMKFSTVGHPKSKGLNMTISCPKSWKAIEGERPNIVQKFVSKGGRGFEMALIITKPLPLPVGAVIPENELKDFFTPAEMRGMVPAGATFIDARTTQIEGLPVGILEYSMRQERAGKAADLRTVTYTFIQGTNLVQLQCMVSTGKLSTSVALARRMAEYKELFFLMANSIILNGRYK
jgi:hypothetical protein